MTHILLIHQAFTLPWEPGGTRHYEFGLHCVSQGQRFTVVASDLSYLTGRPAALGAGLAAEQNLDGMRVVRAYTYPSANRNFFWRIVSFLSFMFTSVLAALRVGRVDLVMGTSPPIFQAVSAWFVSVLRRCPFLLEIRDLWPEFAIDIGVLRNPLLITLSRWLERLVHTRATHILVNSPAYRDYLLEIGIPERKISLIPNGVDPEMFDQEVGGNKIRDEFGLNGKFVVTYAGALGLANDVGTILQAAARLRDDPITHFLLVGDGKERGKLEQEALSLGLTNVTFAGPRPKLNMPDILAASDACIATLKDIPMFRMTYPNKVFDYMAAGRPTILAIDGVIREVMEAACGGIIVPPGDDAALAAATRTLKQERELAQAMGIAARAYVVEHFNRHQQAAQFAELIRKLTKRRGQRVMNHLYRNFGKRLLDLTVTIWALILVSPLFGLVALLVRLKLGSPVVFRQQRPGLYGEPFTLLKFRTMIDTRDAGGGLLPDDRRLARLGRFLRSCSLDELLELVNVLRGDMSLVGPRPLLMQYLGRYTPEQMRRHEVKPGITGWAQVNGRNALTWEQKFHLDVWYVDHMSLWLDLKIIALTAWKILKREGINQPGQATAQKFVGRRS